MARIVQGLNGSSLQLDEWEVEIVDSHTRVSRSQGECRPWCDNLKRLLRWGTIKIRVPCGRRVIDE